MGNLFGKPQRQTQLPPNNNAGAITEKDRAILDLKNARDRLKKYQKKVISRTYRHTTNSVQGLYLCL